MSPILTRRRWTPPPTAKINSNHPLAYGLMSCHLPMGSGMRSMTHEYSAPDLVGVNGTVGAGLFGDGAAMNATGARAEAVLPAGMKTGPAVTVMAAYHRYAAPSNTIGIFGASWDNAAGSPIAAWMLFDLTGNNLRFDYNSNGTDYVTLSGTGANPVGPHIAIATCQAAGQELWVDGARVNAAVGTFVNGIGYSATSMLATGAYSGFTTRVPTQGSAIMKRALGYSL